jgi:hypothetical protein
MQHRFVGDAVLAGTVDNPHSDNISCLE